MRRLIGLLGVLGWMGASAAAAQDAPAQAPDLRGSLFDPAIRQVRIGARLTSVEGDPARFQRYQDMRDGLLFTDVRWGREWAQSGQTVALTADNVGWRNQRFSGLFERPGRIRAAGLWDQIPQFYSVDTRTPYTRTAPGILQLDDATQLAVQRGQGTLNSYVPLADRFDLTERRDIAAGSLVVMPTPHLDLTATFRSDRHVGELPWGASFGFGNDVEVALPYESRTNTVTIGTEWTNQKQMVRVAYDGSWFQNQSGTLEWDNPLRLDDASTAPGRGRTALWPSNSAQTLSLAGYTRLARRTQVTGFVSYGVWRNDEPLLPFTINSALPTLPLPRSTAAAEALVFSTNVGLVSRPADDWRFSARWRQYDYDNRTPAAAIPQFINYDTSVATSATGGPELFAHGRSTASADATWTGLGPLALAVGYTRNGNRWEHRIYERSAEDVVTFSADAVGTSWMTVRARYDMGERTGSGLDEASLVEIGEQPRLRHYDVADRSRRQFTGQVDLIPHDAWVFSVSVSAGQDAYDGSELGLQEASFRVAGASLDYQRPNGLGAGASYNYERYAGLQRSLSANPGAQALDPRREWTTDARERVHYVSIYVTPPRLGRDTEARLAYDYADARTRYAYGLAPDSPLPPPAQLPETYNRLQQLRAEIRHRLSARLALTGSYLYEPFRVYDFAMDQSVIDGIVQPASLVLGYVYRPYTAHSGVVGLMYFW